MRIVAQVPNDIFTVTIFEFNERYILKLEGGPMEQTYKVPKEAVSIEELKSWLSGPFAERAMEIHQEMFLNLKSATAGS